MEQKTKINLLVACGGLLVGGLVAGGAVWAWQQNQAKCSVERANVTKLQRKISQLDGEHQIIQPTELANPGAGGITPPEPKPGMPPSQSGGASAPTGYMVSDQDYLKILTVNEVKSSTVGDHWLPILQHFIDGQWAETSPIPIKYSREQGYHVPGVGGMAFFWHKKDGKWLKVGTCIESGCECLSGYKETDLPVALRRK